MTSLKIKLIVVTLLLGVSIWLICQPRPGEAQVPGRTLFVRGFVAVGIPEATQKLKDIALPNARVFLVRFDDLNKVIASSPTDLSGRFAIKTDATGTFTLCVAADGFPRFCSGQEFRLFKTSKYYGTLRLPLPRNSKSAAAYGEVTLADGSNPRGFEPFLGVNAYGRVKLSVAGTSQHEAYINNFGEYIVPSVPIDSDFSLAASIEKEHLERRIRKLTKLQPGRAYPIDFQFRNSKPTIRVMSATKGGKRLQMATPGSAIVLKAVAQDREGDKLQYRWMLPDGTTIGPTTDSEVPWTVPARSGRFPITVLVSDNHGGYTRSSFSVLAKSGGVPFSGTVVDPNGTGVTGALIEVNGRITNANSSGRFSLEVPLDDKYVLTIRSAPGGAPNPAYGTISFVYTGSIVGGRWVLRPAQVFAVDPTHPIKLQQKRSRKDCQGSLASKIDWSGYLGQGLFEWQDGRGNVRSLSELSRRRPKDIQGVMRLLSRTNNALPRHFAQITKVKATSYDNESVVPCSNGIQIEIPANALENPTTRLAPTGNVEVALSTVDLTSGDQMPGDYSALDSNGKARSMESFGAGGVEIRSGNTRFNLKSGMEATMTIPVDATQIAGNATPPPTIPFLFYDEQKGLWRQDGVATLTGSGASAAYVKKIKHFSSMNADILKSGQSCVAVEVDPLANFTLPFNVEVTLPPSVVNPNVVQVRTLTVDSSKSNVIYNLPNNTNIVLTPIISGVKPDGSVGNVPAGVFVVNTGGPQVSAGNVPTPNGDGTYYAETNGIPTGPCGSRVTLKLLSVPPLGGGFEFLQGFYFEASNIRELTLSNPTVAAAVEQGAVDYYSQSDPRSLRASFNLFKQQNKFGQALNANEVEWDAQYANSGDLGFGRDMHCRRNVGTDGAFDVACYVTNYGQPPIFEVDQLDADHALAGLNPDATVAMEFSRVENALNVNPEFPDNNRVVKFYVYGTDPNGPTVKKADLDGFGERPVPQLCVICHGGQVASVPADPNDPGGPKKGAFTSRNDIMSMTANFLPFDLHLYNFPAAKSKAAQQTNFKNLNRDIVREVAAGSGANGTAIVELIDTINPAAQAAQLEDAVITNWDGGNPASDSHRFYRDVFARACRTCHAAQPFSAPPYTNKVDFQNDIGTVQLRVCSQKIMPHAKRTNDIFWTSLAPSMPAFLQLYGQTFPNWSTLGSSQCGLFFQPGSTPQSLFTTEIYPILVNNCSGCHSAVGNANFSVGGNAASVYSSITTAIAKDGVSKYIVPNNSGTSLIFKRISANPGPRMPLGGPNLVVTDTDNPADGIFDATEILNWINAGAPGP
ncbi:MAG TPA: carboxypeptidase-like regulatory domain-containing protein [Pyrinomonadaceae bacterium]|nr:carboxypeptidase-like regulatory domain-containing protein [Pyrinomonadaceae bacterium]